MSVVGMKSTTEPEGTPLAITSSMQQMVTSALQQQSLHNRLRKNRIRYSIVLYHSLASYVDLSSLLEKEDRRILLARLTLMFLQIFYCTKINYRIKHSRRLFVQSSLLCSCCYSNMDWCLDGCCCYCLYCWNFLQVEVLTPQETKDTRARIEITFLFMQEIRFVYYCQH